MHSTGSVGGTNAWRKRPLAGLSHTRVTLNHWVKKRPTRDFKLCLYLINEQDKAKPQGPNINLCAKKILSIILKFHSSLARYLSLWWLYKISG